MAARERRDDDGRKDRNREREDKTQREPGQDPQREREDGGYEDDRPGSQRERDDVR